VARYYESGSDLSGSIRYGEFHYLPREVLFCCLVSSRIGFMISYQVSVIFVSKKQYSCRKDMHIEIKSLIFQLFVSFVICHGLRTDAAMNCRVGSWWICGSELVLLLGSTQHGEIAP